MPNQSKNESTVWKNIFNYLNPLRKQIGWALVIISTLAWVGIGGLFFLEISVAKQTAISTVLLIIGELAFFGSIPFLGKDIWGSIKKLFLKNQSNTFDDRCNFVTENLSVKSWKPSLNDSKSLNTLIQEIMEMLSDEVTKFLPQEWAEINSAEKSKKWILERDAESSVFIARIKETQVFAGLIILSDENQDLEKRAELHMGFMLSQEYWGKGLGNEMIAGLVSWCQNEKDISSITGGVIQGNHASAKILKNNGFTESNSTTEKCMEYFTRRLNSINYDK